MDKCHGCTTADPTVMVMLRLATVPSQLAPTSPRVQLLALCPTCVDAFRKRASEMQLTADAFSIWPLGQLTPADFVGTAGNS